jgi:hypothetical protein
MASLPASRFNLSRAISLFAIACGLGLLLSPVINALHQNDLVYWNVNHLFKASTKLQLDLTTLRGGYTMEQMKKQFPELDWYCKPETGGMGDTICVDEHIASWNGNPAMVGSFWFRKGRLTHIALQVPRWRHAKVRGYLTSLLGRPHGRLRREVWQADIVAWELRSGAAIVFNLERDPNPLQWSTLLWYSPEEVQRKGRMIIPASDITYEDPNFIEESIRLLIRLATSR